MKIALVEPFEDKYGMDGIEEFDCLKLRGIECSFYWNKNNKVKESEKNRLLSKLCHNTGIKEWEYRKFCTCTVHCIERNAQNY